MHSMCPTTVVPLHRATARDHGDFVPVSWRQTSASPITLDHAYLLVNVVSSNNQFNCEWTRVTAGAYNQNINKRQARKLIRLRYGSQILQ